MVSQCGEEGCDPFSLGSGLLPHGTDLRNAPGKLVYDPDLAMQVR